MSGGRSTTCDPGGLASDAIGGPCHPGERPVIAFRHGSLVDHAKQPRGQDDDTMCLYGNHGRLAGHAMRASELGG